MSKEKRITVQIKGIRDGLLITLGEGDWMNILSDLMQQVEDKSDFFKGARVAIDVGSRELHAAEVGGLRDKLADRDVSMWALISESPMMERTAQDLGLATRLSKARPERVIKAMDTNLPGEGAVLLRRTLRSGFKIAYEGHITVIGDVNPGAEIIAGGSIIVWGKLRGLAHAGADGDEKAVVCALDLMPTQLRIAGQIATTPTRKGKLQPEMASVQDGQVVAEPWI
jgi:septum site-determining protein MinC